MKSVAERTSPHWGNRTTDDLCGKNGRNVEFALKLDTAKADVAPLAKK